MGPGPGPAVLAEEPLCWPGLQVLLVGPMAVRGVTPVPLGALLPGRGLRQPQAVTGDFAEVAAADLLTSRRKPVTGLQHEELNFLVSSDLKPCRV